MKQQQIGIGVSGGVFKNNGENLTRTEFIQLLKSVGLGFGGEAMYIYEDGESVEDTAPILCLRTVDNPLAATKFF